MKFSLKRRRSKGSSVEMIYYFFLVDKWIVQFLLFSLCKRAVTRLLMSVKNWGTKLCAFWCNDSTGVISTRFSTSSGNNNFWSKKEIKIGMELNCRNEYSEWERAQDSLSMRDSVASLLSDALIVAPLMHVVHLHQEAAVSTASGATTYFYHYQGGSTSAVGLQQQQQQQIIDPWSSSTAPPPDPTEYHVTYFFIADRPTGLRGCVFDVNRRLARWHLGLHRSSKQISLFIDLHVTPS